MSQSSTEQANKITRVEEDSDSLIPHNYKSTLSRDPKIIVRTILSLDPKAKKLANTFLSLHGHAIISKSSRHMIAINRRVMMNFMVNH